MDDVRKRLAAVLAEQGKSYAWLSREIGRNPTYIQQYFTKHVPADLDLRDKIIIARLLRIPMTDLGVPESIMLRNGPVATGAPQGGMRESDADSYTPTGDDLFSHLPAHIGLFVARTNALELHPERIVAGDLMAFDMRQEAIDAVQPGAIVVAQVYDPADFLKARTVIRQYVPPALLITNAVSGNEILSLRDPDAGEVKIMGVLRQRLATGRAVA